MKGTVPSRRGIIVGAAIALLAGCGGSQPPLSPSASPLAAASQQMSRGGSRMLPAAKSGDLLYAVDGAGDIAVFSYPRGKLVGRLTQTTLTAPGGDCVDDKGDVFVTNAWGASWAAGYIVEFAHGGTSPIATLSDPGYYPVACAVDPTTGSLAVANLTGLSPTFGPGNIAIYSHAQGTPTLYSDPTIVEYQYCGYDSSGNLFVDGIHARTGEFRFKLAELPQGSSSFRDISLGRRFRAVTLGPVQWDGRHLAVGYGGAEEVDVYRLQISGSTGTVVGTTVLAGAKVPADAQFWIQGDKIIVRDAVPPHPPRNVGVWNYPSGSFYKRIFNWHDINAEAVVISPAHQ